MPNKQQETTPPDYQPVRSMRGNGESRQVSRANEREKQKRKIETILPYSMDPEERFRFWTPEEAQVIYDLARLLVERAARPRRTSYETLQAMRDEIVSLQSALRQLKADYEGPGPYSEVVEGRIACEEKKIASKKASLAKYEKAHAALATVVTFDPAEILSAFARAKPAAYRMVQDRPEPEIKKGETKIAALKRYRAERLKLVKAIRQEQSRPATYEEALPRALAHFHATFKGNPLSSLDEAFRVNFVSDDDTRGEFAAIDIKPDIIVQLQREHLIQLFKDHLAKRADRFGDRCVTRAERTATLDYLVSELVINDQIDCELVRQILADDPNADVHFRADADPFNVLGIEVDPDVPAPRPPARTSMIEGALPGAQRLMFDIET